MSCLDVMALRFVSDWLVETQWELFVTAFD